MRLIYIMAWQTGLRVLSDSADFQLRWRWT